MERRSLTASVLVHLAALLLLVVILAPVVWLFVMSISSTPDLIAKPLHWWPDTVDLSRYGVLLSSVVNSAGEAFVASLFNSIKVAGMATVAALIVAVPSAWAVSRTPSVGWSLYAVIATYMLPPVALAVPLYMTLAWAGLLNNVFGLALVYLTILAPFTTWLMKSGFDSIPREIESAATMDGARLDPDPAADHPAARRTRHGDGCTVRVPACLGRILLCPVVYVGPAGQNLDRCDR